MPQRKRHPIADSAAASTGLARAGSALPGDRLNFAPGDVKNGLGKLVLILVKLLHERSRSCTRSLDAVWRSST